MWVLGGLELNEDWVGVGWGSARFLVFFVCLLNYTHLQEMIFRISWYNVNKR